MTSIKIYETVSLGLKYKKRKSSKFARFIRIFIRKRELQNIYKVSMIIQVDEKFYLYLDLIDLTFRSPRTV
jgi:hypothetical protein